MLGEYKVNDVLGTIQEPFTMAENINLDLLRQKASFSGKRLISKKFTVYNNQYKHNIMQINHMSIFCQLG